MFSTETVIPVYVVFVMATMRAMNSVSNVARNNLKERTASGRLSNNIVYSNLKSSLTTMFNMLPGASFDRGMNLITVGGIMGHFSVTANNVFLVTYNLFPGLTTLVSVVPRDMLNNTTIVVFSSVIIDNVRLVAG